MKAKRTLWDKTKNVLATVGAAGILTHTFVVPYESTFKGTFKEFIMDKNDGNFLVFENEDGKKLFRGNPEDFLKNQGYTINYGEPLINPLDYTKINSYQKTN